MRKAAEIKLVASIYGVLLAADFIGFTLYAALQSSSVFSDWLGLAKAIAAAAAFTLVLTTLFVQRRPVLLRWVAFFGIFFTGSYLENNWIGFSAIAIVFLSAFLYWRIVKNALTPDEAI